MNEKQSKTLEILRQQAINDRSILAVILSGSIAKGTETDRSDVDVLIVVTDERFQLEKNSKNYFWGTDFDSSIFPTEVDGQIVPKGFLRKALDSGNESIKSKLCCSRLIYSKDREIGRLLSSFEEGPLDKLENIKKFYALMVSARFSADDDLSNIMFVRKCVFDTVFFACRLVLAHNDVLYPCVKNLTEEIANCTEKPDGFLEQVNDVLADCSFEKLVVFYDTVSSYFSQYRFDNRLRKGYVLENELFWFFDTKPFSEL